MTAKTDFLIAFCYVVIPTIWYLFHGNDPKIDMIEANT